MYLKSRNILNLSCENRLYRVSNEKNIIDYIKEFFKKIIEYIKKFIDKIKQFFNFKEKQIITKIETVKEQVNKMKVDEINEVINMKNSENSSHISIKDFLLAIIDFKFNNNTIDKIIDLCNYKYKSNIIDELTKHLENGRISFDNNFDAIAEIRRIPPPEFVKNLCKFGNIPVEHACLTFFSNYNLYHYEYDTSENEFKKIISDSDKVNYKQKDLKVDITKSELEKALDKLSKYFNNNLHKYMNELNSKIMFLLKLTDDLEDLLEDGISNSTDKLKDNLNEQLKIIKQTYNFSIANSRDIVETFVNISYIIPSILNDIINKD